MKQTKTMYQVVTIEEKTAYDLFGNPCTYGDNEWENYLGYDLADAQEVADGIEKYVILNRQHLEIRSFEIPTDKEWDEIDGNEQCVYISDYEVVYRV